MITRYLTDRFDEDIEDKQTGLSFPRKHKIEPNRFGIRRWTDVIDVTRGDEEDRHVRHRPGDRHAALQIPIPLRLADWLLYAWMRWREIVGKK